MWVNVEGGIPCCSTSPAPSPSPPINTTSRFGVESHPLSGGCVIRHPCSPQVALGYSRWVCCQIQMVFSFIHGAVTVSSQYKTTQQGCRPISVSHLPSPPHPTFSLFKKKNSRARPEHGKTLSYFLRRNERKKDQSTQWQYLPTFPAPVGSDHFARSLRHGRTFVPKCTPGPA